MFACFFCRLSVSCAFHIFPSSLTNICCAARTHRHSSIWRHWRNRSLVRRIAKAFGRNREANGHAQDGNGSIVVTAADEHSPGARAHQVLSAGEVKATTVSCENEEIKMRGVDKRDKWWVKYVSLSFPIFTRLPLVFPDISFILIFSELKI